MSEKNYVVNVKNKQGTIITFRGDTAQELNTAISDFIEVGLEFAIGNVESILLNTSTPAPDAVTQVAQALNAVVVSETPVAQPPTFAPVPPPVSSTPAGVGDKHCQHGTMIKRTGSGAKGEWRGFFCPTPKGTADQCKPTFAQRNTPDWNAFV